MRPHAAAAWPDEGGARAGDRGARLGAAMTGSDATTIESFLDMMSAERGASINTLAAYRRDLLDFAGPRAGKGGSARDASRDDIKAYLERLSRAGTSSATQARRLSALRQFFAFLYGEGIRKDDPTNALDAPRRERPLPKILSREDVETLIATARADETAEGLRLLCMLEILYASGLRVSELVTLPLATVKNREGFMLVKGKGQKERHAPLNEPAREAIKAWLDVREEFLPTGASRGQAERVLFPSPAVEWHL